MWRTTDVRIAAPEDASIPLTPRFRLEFSLMLWKNCATAVVGINSSVALGTLWIS
jgi:hypothetical protein